MHGVIFETTDIAKSDLYLAMLPRVNSGTLELLDLPDLTRELRGLQRRRGASGRDRVDHRPGAHDDRANAVAGLISLLPDSASQPEDARISVSWIEQAQKKGVEVLERRLQPGYKGDGRGTALGLVVAADDSDLTFVSIVRNGLWETPLVKGRRAFHVGRDVTLAVSLVQGAIEDLRDVRAVVVADFALGQAVTRRLFELRRDGTIPRYFVASRNSPLDARACFVGIDSCNLEARAWSEHRFASRKDELWWNA